MFDPLKPPPQVVQTLIPADPLKPPPLEVAPPRPLVEVTPNTSALAAIETGNGILKTRKILTYADYHRYQRKGIHHLITQRDANLWLFLGAGKTIIALSAFMALQKLGLARKMLVVAPKKVCELVWDDECTHWQHLRERKFTFSKMIGSEKKKQLALFAEADIYLVNYESIGWLTAQLKQYFIKQNQPLPFDYLVWDEVSKMKRKESNRFKDFVDILPHFSRRVGLTASPSSNGLMNVWAQSYMTDMGMRLGCSYDQFLSKYFHNEGGQYGKWVCHDEGATRTMIVNALADNTLEVPMKGNLDLPPISEQVITVTLPPKRMREYLSLERQFFAEMDNGTTLDVFNEASLANKLLQFANGIVYSVPDPAHPEMREEIPIHRKKYEAF